MLQYSKSYPARWCSRFLCSDRQSNLKCWELGKRSIRVCLFILVFLIWIIFSLWSISNVLFHFIVHRNYVVQFLVKKNILEVNAMLVSKLQYKFVGLSTDKYASNVVEDLLHYSRTEDAAIIVEEIMESPNFIQVVQDQYGNYVLQRALQYTEVWHCCTQSYFFLSGRTFWISVR